MGNNLETWAFSISLLSLAVATISLVWTRRFRREQIDLQMPILDFWTDVEKSHTEWTTTVWLQNKGASAAEIVGWSVFSAGKPVDLPCNRDDWHELLQGIGIVSKGGWCVVIDPGFTIQAHYSLKILELLQPIDQNTPDDQGIAEFDRAFDLLNIKCQYASPAVGFEEEIYLRDPKAYAEHVRTLKSKHNRK
jgi:hypothetical protein